MSDKIPGFLKHMMTDTVITLGKWNGEVIRFYWDNGLLRTNWHGGETFEMDGPGGNGGWDWWLDHDDDPASFEPADDKFGFALLQGLEHNAELYHIYENYRRYEILARALNDFGEVKDWSRADEEYLQLLTEKGADTTWEKLCCYIKQNFNWELANKYEREWYKKQGRKMLDEDIAFIQHMLSDLDSVQTWKFSESAVDRTRGILLRIQNRLTATRGIEFADRSKLFRTPAAEDYSRMIAEDAKREAGKYGSDHIDVLADEEPNQFKEHSLHIYYHSNNNSFMAFNPNLALEAVNKEKLKALLDEIGVGYNF